MPPIHSRSHRTVREIATGNVLSRHAVDARELVASGEYTYADAEEFAAARETVATKTAQEENDPSAFAQAVITSTVDEAAKLIAALDPDTPTAADFVARAIELEDAGKARKAVLQLLREAQKRVEDFKR